ncbi:MAG: LuxR C-terminal-related transcriptional regulator [Roseiflexaceae bacterium]
MLQPLLTTKLHRPQPRTHVVARAGLIGRLQAGRHRRLSLIAAPPGFGKTTLASMWVAASTQPAAWLSLDPADSEPLRFVRYVIAALQTTTPTIGAEVMALLDRPQPPPIEALLPLLLNDLAACEHPAMLVLDDYHLIDAPIIDQMLATLIEYLPPRWHVAIATRTEPRLPLARLRARGQLNEVAAADLRLTSTEAGEFLRLVMDLQLSPAEVALLADRTEGWIAGLQLAALSLQQHADIGRFVQAFAGTHRYIADYLVEEVLQHQPEPLRQFLLQTAILERLHGPLCAAVTGQAESQAHLEALERGHFFLVPLDDSRQWYRYHQLFGEVLLAQLQATAPQLVPALHLRASQWYQQHGLLAEAIRHALAAGDAHRAADLIERSIPAMRQSRQEALLLRWLVTLPADLLRSRPVLSVGMAGAMLAVGELNGIEAHLRSAEEWLEAPAAQRCHMIVADPDELPRLPGAIAMYRACVALATGAIDASVAWATEALELIPADDPLMYGATAGLLSLAAWSRGDLVAARQMFTTSIEHLRAAQHFADVLGCMVGVADLQLIQGQLRAAAQTYEQGLALAMADGVPYMRGIVDMAIGLSEVAYQQNDLERARQLLQQSQAWGEPSGLPQSPYRWRVAMALVQAASEHYDDALVLLGEAERRYVSDFFPNIRPIAALKVRIWLAQGRLHEAQAWAYTQGLHAADRPRFEREYESITLAMVLLASAQSADDHAAVLQLLDRLLESAEAGGRMGSMIDILLVQVCAHHTQGNMAAAVAALEHALRLAEPEGYLRCFLDHGQPIASVLTAAAKHSSVGLPIHRVLAAFGVVEPSATPPRSRLIEPLSERERAVLQLLTTDLSGPEIAQRLMVSLNTLRTHTQHIYDKLGAHSRRAAVRRAQELGLC